MTHRKAIYIYNSRHKTHAGRRLITRAGEKEGRREDHTCAGAHTSITKIASRRTMESQRRRETEILCESHVYRLHVHMYMCTRDSLVHDRDRSPHPVRRRRHSGFGRWRRSLISEIVFISLRPLYFF